QVTKSQSLTLVKNLIRVSISTVCHLRNIFPGSCFQERSYAGMRIYQLDAASRDASTNETVIRNHQAYMLTKWLESGVFEAVERRYLRRMEFIILSPELNNPRESYSFELDYPEDENDHSMMFSGTKVTNVESTKGQLIKLIRSLIQFSNTLEELPKERVINIKLWYFDERTPPDWEPKHFEAADPRDLCFKKEADHHSLRVRIGELRTPHHTLKVQFRGIDTTLGHDGGNNEALSHDETLREGEDAGPEQDEEEGQEAELGHQEEEEEAEFGDHEEEEEEEEEQEERAERGVEPLAGRDVSRMVSGMMNHLDVSGNVRLLGTYITRSLVPHESHSSVDTRSFPKSTLFESVMDAARNWTKAQARPTIKGLESNFEISRDQARECMEQMVKEGLLTKANYRYYPANPALPTALPDTTREEWRSGNDYRGQDIGSNHADELLMSQSSSATDGSATQDRELTGSQLRQSSPTSSMPPPLAPGRREGSQGRTPNNRGRRNGKDFATPPIPNAPSRPSLQPVPEKPAQAMILSMGTKRVLDEAVLSSDEHSQHSDPID
ncbi:unnamed protein product, partial [Laminaria digitata]